MTYNGVTYTCLQGHTALAGWEPSNVPALWKAGSSTPTAPAVPKGLTATAVDSASIRIAWTAVTGATRYDLEVDGVAKSGVTSPFSHTGLVANSKHTYRVRAANGTGTSAWSTAVSATTAQATQPPAAPTGLKVSAATSTSLALGWTAVAGASDYDLQADGKTISSVANPFLHAGLLPQTAHTYAVRARNAAGSSAWSATVTGTTSAPEVPLAPANLAASATSSTQISVTWSPSNGASSCDLEVDGTVKIGVTSPYANAGLAPKSTHSYRVLARNAAGASPWSPVVSATTPDSSTTSPLPRHILVGYWHNFDNGTGFIRLKDVSPAYDVINVAFAETAGDHCTATFTPYLVSPAEFKADLAALKAKGKRVVLSIGGQNGSLILGDAAARQKFVDSMGALVADYGFDGLDLDVETGVALGGGDTDFASPTTPAIVNLIAATRAICTRFGKDFILSMAPEIAYVQGGITAYGGPWGAYLPIIHGLRDQLTYVHVQHYNAGGNAALDGANYNQGTADFQVAMAEMLLKGFPVAGKSFPALRQDQVMIGLPATGPAAPSGGYIAPASMKKALDYLMKGASFGGAYKLVTPTGYPDFRGLMTWSVNWDAKSSFEFSTSYRPYLDAAK